MSITHGKTPNSARPAGARNKFLRADREKKRSEAKVRQEAYDKLTPKQKLQRLDDKFGKDQGAKRERERIIRKAAERIITVLEKVPELVAEAVQTELKSAKSDKKSARDRAKVAPKPQG